MPVETNKVEVKIINSGKNRGTNLFAQVIKLRNEVLKRPHGYPDLTEEDLIEETEFNIFVAVLNGIAIGCIHLMPIDAHTARVRQVAILPEFQGQNIGRFLHNEVLKYAEDGKILRIYVHGLLKNSGFYLKLGYKKISEPYVSDGLEIIKLEKFL